MTKPERDDLEKSFMTQIRAVLALIDTADSFGLIGCRRPMLEALSCLVEASMLVTQEEALQLSPTGKVQ